MLYNPKACGRCSLSSRLICNNRELKILVFSESQQKLLAVDLLHVVNTSTGTVSSAFVIRRNSLVKTATVGMLVDFSYSSDSLGFGKDLSLRFVHKCQLCIHGSILFLIRYWCGGGISYIGDTLSLTLFFHFINITNYPSPNPTLHLNTYILPFHTFRQVSTFYKNINFTGLSIRREKITIH